MYKTIEDLYSENEIKMNSVLRQEEAFVQGLFAKHPALEELFAKRQTLLTDALGKVVRAPKQGEAIKKQTQREIEEIDDQIAAYYVAHQIPPMDAPEVCPICEGNGAVGGKMCICMKERMYQEVFGGEDYRVQEGSFGEYDIARFPEDNGQRAFMAQVEQLLHQYADAFPQNPKKQLIFTGEAGLGKSFSAIALLKAVAQKEPDICYISAFQLFSYLHRFRLGEVSAIEPLYEVAVLAIDDLGSEPMTQNVTREMLFDLLVTRKRKSLHTIIVTNNSPMQLKERYTERVFSRLLAKEDSLILPFKGKDLRLLSKLNCKSQSFLL